MGLKKSSLRSKLTESNELNEAVETSHATKDYGSFRGIFEQSKTSGIKFWKPQAGEHCVDILPYIAGDYNPRRRRGKVAYIVDLFVHRNVGPNDDQYICMAKTYSEPCPICEFRGEKAKDPDSSEEEIKALKPSRRAIYAIWDGKDQRAGVQIWEVAHWFMEHPIQAIVKKPKGGGLVDFPHPDHGKSVAFEIKMVGKNKDYIGHQFVDRDEPIPDEILEKVPTIDELLHVPTYDEVHAAFFGASLSDMRKEPEPTEPESEIGEEFQEEFEPEAESEDIPAPQLEVVSPKKKIMEKEGAAPTCPYEEFGIHFGDPEHSDTFQECSSCNIREECKKVAGME